MTNQYTISVTINGDDNASSAFRRVKDGLEGIDDKTRSVGNAARDSSSGVGAFGDEIRGAVAAIGLFTVADKVGEVLELGRETRNTSAAFAELTTPLGNTADILEDLRNATDYAVNDLTLMTASNAMLKTGLADSRGELEQFIDMAIGLTGSADGAMEFTAAINNMSIERLDQLGISAVEVRKRWNELKESGLDTGEAFKQAVLEQGAITLERLGSAANIAQDGVARLNVSIQNLVQQTSSAAYNSIDQLIQLIEISAGTHPIQMQQQAAIRAQAEADAEAYYAAFWLYGETAMGSEAFFQTAATNSFYDQFVDTYAALLQNPDLLNSRDALMETLTTVPAEYQGLFADAFVSSLTQGQAAEQALVNAGNAWQTFAGAITQPVGTYDLVEQLEAIEATTAKIAESDGIQTLIDQERELQTEAREAATAYREQFRDRAMANAEYRDIVGELTNSVGNVADMFGLDRIDEFSPDIRLDQSDFQSYIPEYMTDEGAYAIEMLASDAEMAMERLKELRDQDLITDAQFEDAQRMSDNLRGMADEAQNAADRMANITLPQIFGQTDGGMAGQIVDQVMEDIQARVEAGEYQLTEDEIAGIQQGFELSTGEQTAASVNMEEVIAPMLGDIAVQLGTDAGNVAVQRVSAFLREATLDGLSPEQIAAGMEGATGFTQSADGQWTDTGVESPNFEEMFGDTTVIATDMTTITENMTALSTMDTTMLNGQMDQIQQAVVTMAGVAPGLKDDFGGMGPQIASAIAPAQRLQEILQRMASQVTVVRVKVEVDSSELATVIQNAGGVPPGTDPRNLR